MAGGRDKDSGRVTERMDFGFAAIPHEIRRYIESGLLRPTDLVVYWEIVDCINNPARAEFPGTRQVSEFLRIRRHSAQDSLARLQALRLITRHQDYPNGPVRYERHPPRAAAAWLADPQCPADPRGGVPADPRVGSRRTPRPDSLPLPRIRIDGDGIDRARDSPASVAEIRDDIWRRLGGRRPAEGDGAGGVRGGVPGAASPGLRAVRGPRTVGAVLAHGLGQGEGPGPGQPGS